MLNKKRKTIFFENQIIGLLIMVIWLLSIMALSINAQQSEYPKPSSSCSTSKIDNVKALELKKTLSCLINKGEKHQYQIQAKEGQFLHLIIEQKDIDVAETISGPNNFIRERQFPSGNQGKELFSWFYRYFNGNKSSFP